jgi:GNAT superfamily N-acetyltransferase
LEQGVQWRHLRLDDFENELRGIFKVSLESFRNNFLYTPLSERDFLDQYLPIRDYVNEALTLVAEIQGEPVGFLFAIPDWLQAKRGGPVDTFIIKTVAVRPGRRNAGLGSVLVDEIQAIGKELGFRRCIHALMHESNASRNISGHYAQTIRRYTLFYRAI